MNALSAKPAASVAPRAAWPRVRQQWDVLVRYLPLLLMGLLAMVAYWLVRQTPEPQMQAPEQVVRHVPDYFMRGFSLKVYAADGRLETRVQGERAEHYPDTDQLEVIHPRLSKVDDAGRVTDASAELAITTPQGQQVELKGQAVVRRAGEPGSATPSFEMRSDYLFIDLEQDVMRTDRPVEVLRGSDRFTADALDYDHKQGISRMTGRVHGVLQPRSTR